MSNRISSTFSQSRKGAQTVQAKRGPETQDAKNAAHPAAAATSPGHHVQVDPALLKGTPKADEVALRQFDLQTRYGPVSGISRMQRWERAAELGLAPPEHVKALIMKRGENTAFNQHLFTEGKV